MMGLDMVERFERVLAHAAAFEPDAYFFTGDFCAMEPTDWAFHWLADRLKHLEKPYYLLPGNHDDRMLMRKYFPLPGQGDSPIVQRVQLKGQVFLLLDTRYAQLDAEQENWLRAALEADPGAVVVMHHPPIKLGQPFMDNKYSLQEAEGIQSILREALSPVHVFCGHYHSARTVFDENLIVHLCPPTSFYIKPGVEEFEQDLLPPGYLQISWTSDQRLRVTPVYVTESASIPTTK